MRMASLLAALAFMLAAMASRATAVTVPSDVANAVHGRVVGWARSGSDWFVVYLDHAAAGGAGCAARLGGSLSSKRSGSPTI